MLSHCHRCRFYVVKLRHDLILQLRDAAAVAGDRVHAALRVGKRSGRCGGDWLRDAQLAAGARSRVSDRELVRVVLTPVARRSCALSARRAGLTAHKPRLLPNLETIECISLKILLSFSNIL